MFLFGAMVCLVLIWFALVIQFRAEMYRRHRNLYDSLHLDEVWQRHNGRAVGAVLRFLFSDAPEKLGDQSIARLCGRMRNTFRAAVVTFAGLLLAFFLVPPEQTARSADTAAERTSLEKAYELHRADRYGEAIVYYDEEINGGNTDPEVFYWRGIARWHLDQYESALSDFRVVIREQPDNFEAHKHADRLLSYQKRWPEVLELWNRYLRRNPNDERAYYERGGTYFHSGDRTAAERDANQACVLGHAEACDMLTRHF